VEACVWAQYFRRHGVAVTLFSPRDSLLPEEDPFAAEYILKMLRDEGVEIILSCREWHLERIGNLRAATCLQLSGKSKVLADEILFCYPRVADWSRMGDAKEATAEPATEKEATVLFAKTLQKKNRRIEAVGPACGEAFIPPHAAEASGREAVRHAVQWFSRLGRKIMLPQCIPTDPPVVRIGLSRQELLHGRIPHETHYFSLAEADALLPESRRQGWVMLYMRPGGKKLLGAVAAAPDADELLAPIQLLMTYDMPLTALERLAMPQPSRLHCFCEKIKG
jgi:pyruvate/2-oxoglutarate dehydrogenase complex dihydrolipoamide dehydrogenase (E3) component